jgi:hypothetical protein
MASPLANTYAKGRFVEKCMFPLGTDNILVVPLQSTGIPTDNIMRNCQTLAAIFTAGGVEATFTNYTRRVLAAADITITYDLVTNFRPTVSFATQVWAAAGGAINNTLAAIVLAYRPTSGTADSGCLPLAVMGYSGTTTGGA